MQYRSIEGKKQKYLKVYQCMECFGELRTGEMAPVRCPACKFGAMLIVDAGWEDVQAWIPAEPKDVLGRILGND